MRLSAALSRPCPSAMTPIDPRQQAALDAAMNQIKATVASVADRVSETLGLMSRSATRISERDLMNSAQFELRRNMGPFQLAFRDKLRERIDQELTPRLDPARKLAATDWQSLSLVDDNEMEELMYSDRIGQLITHECEAELRELAGYMGSLLRLGSADAEHNPLRAEIVGAAAYHAIEAASNEADVRKLLARELGTSFAKAMRGCYQNIVRDLQARGVRPEALMVRGVDGPGNRLPGVHSGYAGLGSTRSQSGELDNPNERDFGGGHYGGGGSGGFGGGAGAPATNYGRGGATNFGPGGGPSMPASFGPGGGRTGPTSRSGLNSRSGVGAAQVASQADAQLMALLRRLTAIASRPGELDPGPRGGINTGAGSVAHSGPHTPFGTTGGVASGVGPFSSGGGASGMDQGGGGGGSYDPALTGLMAVNLIRAHREELLQASTGKLDHMVIDVVGSLFDQILSDSRVPPQMARQIARLQLPVLRVALNDSTFFSSRRHPVRRFVNRIASLACAFDEFDDGPGKQFLARVRELVQEIVEGDFDQIELYASKLAALEHFIAEQTHREAERNGALGTIEGKESELRLQQRFMLQLQAALKAVSLPPYLREFLPQVWSQALVLAVTRDGVQSERAKRYRRAGVDLVMSIQPKGSPAMRKKFLMQLPPLMKDLNEGLALIGWPEAAQRAFFAELLPAHAESLKQPALSELDHNLLVKQLEAIFNTAVPGTETLSAADAVPELDEATLAKRFTPEEAKQVGLIDESAVDWSGMVDIDLADTTATVSGVDAGATTQHDAADTTDIPVIDTAALDLNLAPGLDLNLDRPNEPPEPTRGPQLMDHIKLGFAYQMHLKDEWQKVRLTHVSAGRSFFVFTRGRKHQETISMTSRMLARMCETGRMRAFESSYLMERATQRARKQLAALKVPTRV